MEWKPEYSTGIQRIDEQHQMLFQMVGDFQTALDEGRGERTYGLLLRMLADYAQAHFGFEESCMVRYACPVARQNREAHAGFLRMLSDWRTRHESHGYQPGDARQMTESLSEWLRGHICRIDLQLRASAQDE